ncbi:acyl-[ACP]--phospholipid O-acyltransferase [Helicobacter himalayensis]|uniref:acyl-[ACP]--phospholipid O-acyltransferase n=1 Tax=Helicobacter himalayensis TaxID=1591088 RepID=UPI003D6F5550
MKFFKTDSLFLIKGFVPFLAIGFLNAFVDLGHKILIQNTIYHTHIGSSQLLLTSIVNLLILLPFVLAFSPAGFLADKFPKNKVMRISAWVSVGLCCFITICYFNGAFWLAFFATLLMAFQSAIYSPAKFGFIKELVGKECLASGNGAIQAVSIVAILCGIGVFSFLFEIFFSQSQSFASSTLTPSDVLDFIAPLGFLLIFFALCELYLSYKLPTLTQTQNIHFDTNAYKKGALLKQNITILTSDRAIWLCIIGLSFFYALSQLYIASFPSYAKSILEIESAFSVNLAIALSGVGIILGALFTTRLSKHYIELGLVPLGAFGIFLISIGIAFGENLGFYMMLFFFFGICGAFFSIPLNSLIQFRARDSQLGTILAGNNFLQNIAMIGFLLLSVGFAYLEISVEVLFYLMMFVSAFGALSVVYLMPFSLARLLVSLAFFQRYRLIVDGFKNFPERGGVLLLGNHISFIDWAIVQMALPRKVFFMMERSIYSRWYIRIFLDRFGVIPVSSAQSKGAIELAAQKLQEGKVVCIFPEGAISRHGHLNAFKGGFELVCKNLKNSQACILPFYIRGLWGSSFSRSDEQFQLRYRSFARRDIAIAFGEKMDIHSTKESVKARIFELSFKAWESQCQSLPSLDRAWIDSAKKYGSKVALVDSMSGSFSYYRLLALSLALSSKIKTLNAPSQRIGNLKECVGVILPASLASSLCNFSVLLSNKIVINLNFTASKQNFSLAIERAKIRHIFTSRQFLAKLENKGVKLEFPESVCVHYMEDIIQELKAHKATLLGYIALSYALPAFVLKALFCARDGSNLDVATILFSSGSEGIPKGVMLNHLNIMSNIAQITDALSVKDSDILLSSLPPFHAFGLTVTTFFPLLQGIPSITCADPTDAVSIARAVARNKATILCGTSTFLGIYARNRNLHAIMFESLRLVIAGAEKLKPEVRQAFSQKFHKPIYEGYGATETTPVASVNLPTCFDEVFWELHKANKEGSVGMPLPGTAVRIINPETLETLPIGEQGLVLIGGHQVMVGYLNDEARTRESIIELDGIRWYKSGDKGYVDKDGFLHIVDRYARFAKIGGEMLSLGALEEQIAELMKGSALEEVRFSAVGVDDAKKGESIVLLIESLANSQKSHAQDSQNNTFQDTDSELLETFSARIKHSEMPALYKPARYFIVEKLPILGSGKLDLVALKALAKSLMEA